MRKAQVSEPETTNLECVINISEGQNTQVIKKLAEVVEPFLLDLHRDPYHNRCVLTLYGKGVQAAVRSVTELAVELLDINNHSGSHPRFGVVDVVPFVPLTHLDHTFVNGDVNIAPAKAIKARDNFAAWAATTLDIPCFLYEDFGKQQDSGRTQRSLPYIRKEAFRSLMPDLGPHSPHPTAGAIAVGARDILIAYNIWLYPPDIKIAKKLASKMRGPFLRTLGIDVGEYVQVSCNLIRPFKLGPAEVFDICAHEIALMRKVEKSEELKIQKAELVGLIPTQVLAAIPKQRWNQLGLSPAQTVESAVFAKERLF
ncbi:MAG: hypothetical protein M1483_02760 [Actinobacteria bacterium]|nr:hypothetical protein [Actinomycetota bacterium]MCL6104546.1 hypothetical protein [Actinomycetota bacterium]